MLGWSQETTLDTQYAHAMAPAAHIVLFVARSDDDLTLEQAVESAVRMFPHSVISQSFGDPEFDMIQGTCFLTTNNPTGNCTLAHVQRTLNVGESAYKEAVNLGTTVFASAGDWGADNSGLCIRIPSSQHVDSQAPTLLIHHHLRGLLPSVEQWGSRALLQYDRQLLGQNMQYWISEIR